MEQDRKADTSAYRPVTVAAVVATCIMFVFGVAYRVVVAKQGAPPKASPIAQSALDQFPLRIGDWTGKDVPLDAAIIRETDTDARINRLYLRHNGLESISFYVAGGVRVRDLMPHRPEVCYTGSGWRLGDSRTQTMTLSTGAKLPCKVFQFFRGALSTQRVVVLYYYIVDGEYYADVSALRSRIWRGSDAVGYVGQVELVTPITEAMGADAAARLVSEFAVESAPLTAELFRNNQKGVETSE